MSIIIQILNKKYKKFFLFKRCMVLILLTFAAAISAQELPNGGAQLRQIPSSPSLEPLAPNVLLERPSVDTKPDTSLSKIQVNSLHITGQQLYSEELLLSLTGFIAGQQLSLGDLQQMAANITDYYHENGYFATSAYLPAQEIREGAVTITVVEGVYGDINLRNQSNLSDNLANHALEGLHSGEVIEASALENHLLLLSDIPGVNVKSTLLPGASLGAADLIVDVTPGQTVTGSIDADNAGNYYTGEYRLGTTLNINNLAGQGDVASLRLLSSFNGLNYGRASYQMQFGKATAGVAYSRLEYELGKKYSDLDAHGTVDIASVFVRYPFLRSRQSNLYGQLDYDYKIFDDRIDAFSLISEKNIHVVMASLHGNHRDNFGGGGLTAGSLTWSTGVLDIESSHTNSQGMLNDGHYNTLKINLMRLQRLTDLVSLYGSVSGQVASKALHSSEQLSLGGMYGVRAYPQGEAFGDQGYLAALEARLLLPQLSQHQLGQMHLIGFVDYGSVSAKGSSKSQSLSGAGVGFNWIDSNNFSVKASYAHKLSSDDATAAPDSSGRFWIQLVKFF